MSRLTWLFLALLSVSLGCSDFDHQAIPLVHSAPSASAKPIVPERQVSTAPATEESARRLLQVGQRLILANSQIGLRPRFIAPGVPYAEVFHKGGSLGGCLIVVSEGLVKACVSDAQLAAVVALELGRLVAEREALISPSSRHSAERLPPNERIGSDSGGSFGSSDGTRMMELARLESRRAAEAKKPHTADPEKLAAGYLTRAGYDPGALVEIKPLLRQAEDHDRIEKQFQVVPPR